MGRLSRHRAEIAVLEQEWRQRSGILICDIARTARRRIASQGEGRALFAAREDARRRVEGGDGGLIDLCGGKKSATTMTLLVLFGSGGDGFAELREVEAWRMAKLFASEENGSFATRSLRLWPGGGGPTDDRALKRFQ